ncbi:MAG: FlgB family protein [Marinosulfonomonas sp.]|nr:FlgB family protein [Marinosulfonomonas sp.]
MFDKIEIFRLANGLAVHSANRQSVIAQNIANSDTPGYRAKDTQPFSDTYVNSNEGSLRITRSKHLKPNSAGNTGTNLLDAGGESSPNGNTVSLELEMVKATEVRRQHDLALSVYSSSLNILRTSLGRGR